MNLLQYDTVQQLPINTWPTLLRLCGEAYHQFVNNDDAEQTILYQSYGQISPFTQQFKNFLFFFHTPFVLFLIINKSSIIICNNQLLISSNNFFFFCLDSFQLLPFKLIHFIQVIRSLHPQCQRYVHPGVDAPYIGDQGASSWPCVHVDSAAS